MRKTSLLSILVLGVALVWGTTAKAQCPAFGGGVIVSNNSFGFAPSFAPSFSTFNSFGFVPTNGVFVGNSFGFQPAFVGVPAFGVRSFNARAVGVRAPGVTVINNRFGPFGGLRRQQVIIGR